MLAFLERQGPLLSGAIVSLCVAALGVWAASPAASRWIVGGLIVGALTMRLTPAAGERPSIAWPAAVLLLWPLAQIVPLPVALRETLTAAPAAILTGLAKLGAAAPATISLNPQASLEAFLIPGGCLAALLLAARAGSTASGFVAAAGLVGVGAALSLVGIAQYQNGSLAESADAWAHGTFVHRGHFAAFAAGCGWLAGGAAWATRGRGWAAPLACGAAGTACVAAVMLSHSRMAIAASVTAALALLAVGWRNPAARVPAAGLALVGGLTLAFAGASIGARFEAAAAQGGDPGRQAIWRDAAAGLAAAAPGGSGLGAFAWTFRRTAPYLARRGVEHAHSDYLEWLVELGALVGVGWCLLLGIAVWRIRAGLARQQDERLRIAGGAALLGCLALLLHAAADSLLHAPATAMLAATLLGLAAGAAGTLRGGSPRATTAVLSAALCAWALASGGALDSRDVDQRFRRARRAHLAGARAEAEREYRSALTACPTAATAWLGLAELRRMAGDLDGAVEMLGWARAAEPYTYRVEWPLAEAELAGGNGMQALERLAALLGDLPDLRPAALQMAWRYGVDFADIETHLVAPEGDAVGAYLAFLVRTGNRDLAMPAYRRLSVDRAIEVPRVYLDYVERHLGTELRREARSGGLEPGA